MAVLRPHLALTVADVDRSAPFYEALFGAAPAKVRPGYAKWELAAPALNFTLNQGNRGDGPGALNHAGIQVASTDDVLAARDRLQEAGLATFDEMDTTCCYARQDKVWVRDPDGNQWEVFTTLEDVERGPELPLAGCSLDVAGLEAQRRRARALAPFVRAARRRPDRLEVEFAGDVDAAAVDELLDVERSCCTFLDLEWDRERRALAIAAPGEHREVLDALQAELAP